MKHAAIVLMAIARLLASSFLARWNCIILFYFTVMVMLLNAHDESYLLPDYREPAIYIPSLKSFVTFGHFVLFLIDDERVVGQLLWRNIDSNDAIVSVLLPLYDQDTLQHLNSVAVLPQRVIHCSCVNSSEVVYISKVTIVPVCCIVSIAFVFLAEDVMDYIFHLHPNLHPEHENRYCECIGRSIFSSIEFLRQEIRRILCHYGQRQFPKKEL
jgi:hypothetical protein